MLAAALAVLITAIVAISVRTSGLALLVVVTVAALFIGTTRRLWLRARLHPARYLDKAGLSVRQYWLPTAWVAFTLLFTVKFTRQGLSGSSVSRGGGLTVENGLLVAFQLVIAAVLALRWLPARPDTPRGRYLALLAWPVWAVLSSFWSPTWMYSLVRSLMLLVPLAFAIYSARLLDTRDDDGLALARPFFRLYATVATLLALYAFMSPYHFAANGVVQQDLVGRLAWYGVHPLVAAEVWGLAALVLAVAGPRLLGLSYAGWAVRLGVLCVATGRAQGRSVFVGLVVALLVAVILRARQRSVGRYLGALYYVSICVGAAVLFGNQLLGAAARGEGMTRLFNLNGRLPLWQDALHHVRSLKQIFLGFGFGTSGTLLSPDVAFAGQAHNSLLDALLSAGLIGVLLLVVWLFALGQLLRRRKLPRPLPAGLHAVLGATFGLLIVLSVGSPELATPGFSYSLMCFIAVFVLRSRAGQAFLDAAPRPPVAVDIARAGNPPPRIGVLTAPSIGGPSP